MAHRHCRADYSLCTASETAETLKKAAQTRETPLVCGKPWFDGRPEACQLPPGHPSMHQFKNQHFHIVWFSADDEERLAKAKK